MYKHIEMMPPNRIYASLYWLVVHSVSSVYLRRRKQLPGCKGHWRMDMKLVSLYLRLLINVKLPEVMLDGPRAGADPSRCLSIPSHTLLRR